MSGEEFVPLSLTPLLIGVFAAVACALPGNFLLLRRQALMLPSTHRATMAVSRVTRWNSSRIARRFSPSAT
mgnify:CR=1 FL=1